MTDLQFIVVAIQPAELVRIEISHIEQAPDGSDAALMPFAKNDEEGDGSYRYLLVARLGDWFKIADIDDGPVFRAMRGNGFLMPGAMMTRTVQCIVERYKSQSL